jgi:membrane protein DedA with SNARE-associated domain
MNLLAGMTDMRWKTFLLFNLTGSITYAATYILLGYYFGKQWKALEAWLGPTALYALLAGLALVVVGLLYWGALRNSSGKPEK